MPFCPNCGREVPEGSLFCEFCGARQESPVQPPSSEPAQAPEASPIPEQAAWGGAPQPPAGEPVQPPYSAPPPAYGDNQSYGGQPAYGAAPAYGQSTAVAAAPRKPLPLGAKIAMIVVAVIAVAAAVTLFVLGKLNDPQKTIRTFVDAIIAQDFEQFQSVTASATEELELTEASTAPFFALYSGNTGALQSFQDSLASDLQQLNRGLATTGNGFIRLVQQDHLIYKSYSVEVTGITVSFAAPLDGAKLTLADASLTLPKADEEYELTLLPGLYDLKATASNSALGASFSYERKGLELTGSGATHYLRFEYASVWLCQQDLQPTSLTVNGKDCALPEFDDRGAALVYPLPVDAQLTAVFDYSGVTLTANYVCDGAYEQYFYLEPTLNEDSAPVLLDVVGTFTNDWMQIYASGDAEALQSLCNGGSTYLNSYADELRRSQDTESWRYAYHYTLRELEGNLDWVRSYDYAGENAPCFSTLLFIGLDCTEESLPPAGYVPDPEPDYTNPGYGDPDYDPTVDPENPGGPDGPEAVPENPADPEDPGTQEPTAPVEPPVYAVDSLLRVYVQYRDGVWQVVNLTRAYYNSRADIGAPYSMM